MADGTLISPDISTQQPFRQEVEISQFDRITKYRQQIKIAKEIFPAAEDKPVVADIIASFVNKPDSPNEVKLEAVHEALSLLTDPLTPEVNRNIACTLIDMIWVQKDPAVKYRMASVISHALQDEFVPPMHNEDDPTSSSNSIYKSPELNNRRKLSMEEGLNRHVRQDLFYQLMHDQELNEKYKNYAKFLLHPPRVLKFFNQLYDWDQNLDLTPRIIEEITEETSGFEAQEEELDTSLAAGLVRLPGRYLPTFDKMAEYQSRTGEALPLFIVWKPGRDFHSIRFPADLTRQASEMWLKFRAGEISRGEVFQEAKRLQEAFLSRMNPEQRSELEELGKKFNLEIRFSTERGDTTADQEQSTLISLDQNSDEKKEEDKSSVAA